MTNSSPAEPAPPSAEPARPAASVEELITALRESGLAPESSARRVAEYTFDASNYRVVPMAVLFPRTEDEVAAALTVCHRLGVPAIARGGGTSMAGNAIGTGLILDFSRHMNRVLSVDEAAGTATAETGAVLTHIRAAVHEATASRLTFAPDPSSQSRACLGGAIGNDACGNHSVRHGRTADHVVELRLVTSDGLRLTATRSGVCATDPDDGPARARRTSREGTARARFRPPRRDPRRARPHPAPGVRLSPTPPSARGRLRRRACPRR